MPTIMMNGAIRQFDKGTTYEKVVSEYQGQYNNSIALIYFNGKMKELTKRVDKDGVVSFITTKDPAGHATYVRTAQMMLVKAARDILGSANKQVRIKIEFSLDNACYCSVLGGIRVNTELARKIEERMMEIAEKNIPIIKKNYPIDDAIELFKRQEMKDKEKLFHFRRSSTINVYSLEGYYDYFYGFMMPATGYVRLFKVRAYEGGLLLILPRAETPDQLDEFKEQLASIGNSGELVAKLESELWAAKKAAREEAKRLTAMRTEAKKVLELEIVGRLQSLGMPNVRFEVNLTSAELGWKGSDKVEFLFSANKNVAPQPLSQIASGGEIARVMLSLKVLMASAMRLPTIIFDEIDTGVSGKIAEQMATMMEEMGRQGCQVISITHLPQIAAKGRHHYKVYKEEGADATRTHIAELTADERTEEIAHMLSGATLTEAALNNARSLLDGSSCNVQKQED